MVDAPASFEVQEDPPPGAVDARSPAEIAVQPAGPEAIALYERICAHGIFAPPQSPIWIRNWIARMKPDALIATLSRDGDPLFALALEVTSAASFRVASFMGGTHANGNFAPALPRWLDSATAADMKSLLAALRAARPDIDVLALRRLAHDLDGRRNPLLALPHGPSPNIALAVDLEGGFDAALERISARHKRKKHRSQARKFEAAGGYRHIAAANEDETRRLFDAFLSMKEQRFRKAGVANVFAEAEIRDFFHALFAEALKANPPPFSLEGLEVAGKLRAITGTSRCGKRMICEFGAINDDELAAISPGEFLFFRNIEEAAAQGFALYDFSVGDEPYKRLWCNVEISQADVIVPLTARGRLYAAGARLSAQVKAFIKNSPLAWNLVKAARRRAAGQAVSTPD